MLCLFPLSVYELYHATDWLVMLYPDVRLWNDREYYYQHVATIGAPLDDVFYLTNHTGGVNWTQRPEICWIAPGVSPRSTSVGDVIYAPDTGRVWLIVGRGLQEIVS
jgi:hypothetical protein